MSKAYFGSKISPHMVRTPEGYLICTSVPIARTGWQEYAEQEIVRDSYSDKLVKVYRPEEEVFAPAAIASFEGKTISDGHPNEWVTATNESSYHRGHLQNVRRGANGGADVLLADLFIKDSSLINRIEHGLREVSCGYDCDYEPMDGADGDQYVQRNIRGNHLAVVPSGRAGDRVAIRDAAPEAVTQQQTAARASGNPTSTRSKKMAVNWRTILGLGLKTYAQDAEPEEVAEAFELGAPPKSEEKGAQEMPEELKKDTKTMDQADVMGMLEKILAVLQQLVESDKAVHAELPSPKPEATPEESLDQLETELAGKERAFGGKETPEEEELEEQIGDAQVIEPVETLAASEIPKNPIPGADAVAKISAIRAMKPIIASMKDPVEKKRVTDALIAELSKTKVPTGGSGGKYSDLLRPKKTEDKAAMDRIAADQEYGKQLQEKYHRKPVLVTR